MHPFSFRRIGLAALAVCFLYLILVIPGRAQQIDDQQTLELGAQVYAENCAVCHGQNGEGRVGASLAKDWPSIRPDLRVESTIRSGIPGSPMPAWSQENGGPLDDQQIQALVAYILSWQTGGPPFIFPTPTSEPFPPITPPPGVEGDPNQGVLLFDQNCVVCHGENGEGRIGVTLAKDWPSIRPDLEVKAAIERGIPGSAMPAWGQENGGPLSESQVNDLVSYILTWETAPGIGAGGEEVEAPQPAGGSPITWIVVILVFVVLIGAIVYFSNKARQQS